MSEQPTYWKHLASGIVYRVNAHLDPTYEFYAALNLKNGTQAIINCFPVEHNTLTHVVPIPTPQVGEIWEGDSFGKPATIRVSQIISAEPPTLVHFTWMESRNGTSALLDDFMLNYRKVEDSPKEEKAPIFEPRYYRHNTTGTIEKVITPERVSALENNTDWKRFYYTFQETSKENIDVEETVKNFMNPSFKDKLKEEIDRLSWDIAEINEEVERLQVDVEEMKAKRLEWQDMLDMYERFTDKYCDTLL